MTLRLLPKRVAVAGATIGVRPALRPAGAHVIVFPQVSAVLPRATDPAPLPDGIAFIAASCPHATATTRAVAEPGRSATGGKGAGKSSVAYAGRASEAAAPYVSVGGRE